MLLGFHLAFFIHDLNPSILENIYDFFKYFFCPIFSHSSGAPIIHMLDHWTLHYNHGFSVLFLHFFSLMFQLE